MKSKLEILDRTFRKATAAASALSIPLREFVAQAVDERGSSHNRRQDEPWMECAGEQAHLHNETLRIQKIIGNEFERIEPEGRN
jgi:hypothetical protein